MTLLEKSSFITTDVVTPTLRPYQKQCIADTYSLIRSGKKRILIFAPTGGGKTWIASQIVRHAVDRGRRVTIIVHRDILVEQTAQKLAIFGIPPGFIKAGWKEDRQALVQVASVQTMVKRDWWQQLLTDIVILDEAHLTAYTSIACQMMSAIYPHAIYLGLTATPWRTNRRESLGDIFESLVCCPMPHELITSGDLIKPSYFSVAEADLEKIGMVTTSGDFDEARLALACDRPEENEQTVRDWLRLAKGRRTIGFTVNVAHSRNLHETFLRAGIPSAYVSGLTPDKQAKYIYRQLATLEIQVLLSCMKLVEGTDIPSVSALLLCRLTNSPSLHFQMLGRSLRLSYETEKVDSIIIDRVGNLSRHGFVEDIREISLKPGTEPQAFEAPKKTCPLERRGCGALLYAFQMKCPNCGYLFEQPKIIYLTPEVKEIIRQEDAKAYKLYRQNLKVAYDNNLEPGWAAHEFRREFGPYPPDWWARGAIFGTQASEIHKNSYHDHLQALARRKEKPDLWIKRYMTLEFGFGDLV